MSIAKNEMFDYRPLDQLKQKLDSYRPLSRDIVVNLHDDLVIRWTYNSNAIEGNTLTLKETKVALEGITIGGKTMQEHFEAINHREAINFIDELVTKNEPLSEWQIKSIHQLILKNIDDKNAGAYRKCNVVIAGADHLPPDFIQVQSKMKSFIDWYNENDSRLHPVELATKIHLEFVKIHPFVDGNGRTARLLLNLELIKNGFPPVVIPVEKRLEYYEALDLAHTKNDLIPFKSLIFQAVEKSFLPYWYALGV